MANYIAAKEINLRASMSFQCTSPKAFVKFRHIAISVPSGISDLETAESSPMKRSKV